MVIQRKKRMRGLDYFYFFPTYCINILKFFALIFCVNCLIQCYRSHLLGMKLDGIIRAIPLLVLLPPTRSLERKIFLWLLLFTICSGNLNTPECSKYTVLTNQFLGCQVSRFHFSKILHDAPPSFPHLFLPSSSFPLSLLSSFPFTYFRNEVEQYLVTLITECHLCLIPPQPIFTINFSRKKVLKFANWVFISKEGNLGKILFSK